MLYGECEVNSFGFESGYSVKTFLKPEEIKPGFVSEPFGMHWNGNEWNMFRNHLRRLLGQSPLSHDLKDSNAFDDNDYSKEELMRMVVCCSTPFNPDQIPESTDDVTISMKIKLISNQPVNASRSDKEQGYLAKLAKFCGPKNVRWEVCQLRFYDIVKDASFDNRDKLVWTWKEDDFAWETVTRVTFQNAETMKLYFGDISWDMLVVGLRVYLEVAGMDKVLQQVYSKRGMDGTELREMLEEDRFSDLTITSTNGEDKKKKEIRAHGVVLSAASPHFALMLKNPLKEAETGIVQLPESEEAITAMLHFIYYGGSERILGATADVVLELLMAGEIYMINDLVEVAVLVINAKIYSWNWFSVDAAVKLFCIARKVDGQLWKDLMKKAVEFLERKELNQLKPSEGYLKLYQIAVKLGPVFESVLAMSSDGNGNKTVAFPKVPEGMPKTEVELIYDFLSASSAGGGMPRTLGIAVGILVLAEFCGRGIPIFSKVTNRYFMFEEYSSDFLVELFCTARLKEDKSWQNLKNIAVRKLKELLITKPNEIEVSAKYKEMLSCNPEAAMEFTRLTQKGQKEIAKASKKG